MCNLCTICVQVGRALLVTIADLEGCNPWSRVPQSPFNSVQGVRDWLLACIKQSATRQLTAFAACSENSQASARTLPLSRGLSLHRALSFGKRSGTITAPAEASSTAAAAASARRAARQVTAPVCMGRNSASKRCDDEASAIAEPPAVIGSGALSSDAVWDAELSCSRRYAAEHAAGGDAVHAEGFECKHVIEAQAVRVPFAMASAGSSARARQDARTAVFLQEPAGAVRPGSSSSACSCSADDMQRASVADVGAARGTEGWAGVPSTRCGEHVGDAHQQVVAAADEPRAPASDARPAPEDHVQGVPTLLSPAALSALPRGRPLSVQRRTVPAVQATLAAVQNVTLLTGVSCELLPQPQGQSAWQRGVEELGAEQQSESTRAMSQRVGSRLHAARQPDRVRDAIDQALLDIEQDALRGGSAGEEMAPKPHGAKAGTRGAVAGAQQPQRRRSRSEHARMAAESQQIVQVRPPTSMRNVGSNMLRALVQPAGSTSALPGTCHRYTCLRCFPLLIKTALLMNRAAQTQQICAGGGQDDGRSRSFKPTLVFEAEPASATEQRCTACAAATVSSLGVCHAPCA